MDVRYSGESASCLKDRRILSGNEKDFILPVRELSAAYAVLGFRLFGASAVKKFLTASANRVNCHS